MAAVVNVNRFTGTSPGSADDITSINTRANAEDTHSVAGTSNPVPIDTVLTKYSYWVHTQLEVISGLGGTLDNLRWFMSGALDTGIELKGESASAYVQATGSAGDSGDVLNTTNHPSLAGAAVDLTTYTVGSPKSISGSTTGAGVVGDFMVYQCGVLPAAAPGAATPVNMTWRYDET
jgi:hypothetical protein